jgi:hypothetical protein
VGRPREWWPLSDADPVPGDPETLAGLGRQMAAAAAEIERMAAALPKICASDVWDSEAGAQFRSKAATTAAGIGKAHGRFRAVATALGSAAFGGTGYAAALQECQDQADAAITAVNGTLLREGSEHARLRAWTALLDATGGLDPARPLPPPATGPAALPLPAFPVLPAARVPAGPFPQASPGVIPPYLPDFPDEPATVTALKRTYNMTIDTLTASAQAITRAAAAQSAAAHTAARLIRTAIDSDGLNNQTGFLHWLDHEAGNVTGYVSAHWAGFTRDLADIAGEIATECGIIAMVLAFIPGMQEFAAAFETIALLAQFVSFACHLTLLATGNGGLLDVVVDGIGLVTFGIGKGLIGAAAKTGKVAEIVSAEYRAAIGDGSLRSLIMAGDNAFSKLQAVDRWSTWSVFKNEMRETLSFKPVFAKAVTAFRDGRVGEGLLNAPLRNVVNAGRLAFSFNSPEVGFALSKAAEAAADMPAAQGVGAVMTDRLETYYKLFRFTQTAGVAADGVSKLDSALNAGHVPLPGYDSIKHWPSPAGG